MAWEMSPTRAPGLAAAIPALSARAAHNPTATSVVIVPSGPISCT